MSAFKAAFIVLVVSSAGHANDAIEARVTKAYLAFKPTVAEIDTALLREGNPVPRSPDGRGPDRTNGTDRVASSNWVPAPPQSDPTRSRGEIPFKLSGGYLIVAHGRIGRMDKLKFVLDTGVSHSVVDRKLANSFEHSHQAGRILNFDKNVTAEWVDVPDVQLGPIHVPLFPMIVGDLRYFESFASHIDAVIGLDLLRLSSFSIDYAANRVVFGPIDQSASGVPMLADAICLTVVLQIGNHSFRVLVDTGAQGLVLYEDRVLRWIPELRMVGEINGLSIGGVVPSSMALLPRTQLGSVDVNQRAFLVKAPPGDVLPGIAGYLGTASLKVRRIDFDFETNTLGWKK